MHKVEFIRFIKPGAASTVFVSNLAKDVTASTLHKYFRTFGPIYEIFIKETSDETQISEQQQQQSGSMYLCIFVPIDGKSSYKR